MAYDPIAALIAWVANLLGQILTKLWEGIEWILQWVVSMLESLMNVVWDMLATVFTAVSEALASMVSAIETVLTEIVDAVWSFLEQAWDVLYEATIGVLDSIANYISDLWAKLEVFLAEIIETVRGWIDTAVQWVQEVVDAGLQAVADIAARAGQAIADFAAPLIASVQQALDAAMATINAAWEQLVLGAESILAAIAEKLAGLRDAFMEAATSIVTSLGDISEENLGPIRDAVKGFTEAYLPKEDPGATQRAMVALKGIHTDPTSMANYRAWWEHEAGRLAEAGTIKKALYLTVFFLASLIPTVMGISQILSQPVIQEYSRQFPFQILAPADATAAWRRGLITKGEAIGEVRRAGFDEKKAGYIAELTSLVPAEADLMRMLWRGIIHEADFVKALTHRGYDEPWPERVREASKVIPPVQDLIQMAVREAWDPAAIALGQLEERFPEELSEWTERQGLSPEWALKYWAAHWRLPSILQAFEMRHRDVIDDKALDTLLQALDVAPGWRDPIKAIAFHPYTRVDVRRMHRLGVLSDEEVTRAYLDLGYDDEKAQGLADFTKVLNEPKGVEDDEELGKLSRTAVLGFYEDGLLTRERAAQLLETAGHTPEAAILYLNASDADEERSERKTETALVIELAEAGSLGWDEAEDKLRGLGLETKEVERAITKLLRARQRKTRLPTKGDADAFYVAGLVQDGAYLDLLDRLGYSPKWTQMYLKIARLKRGKA